MANPRIPTIKIAPKHVSSIKYGDSVGARNNAITDVIYVLKDHSMWLNEKGMLLKAIDILYSLGYYYNNDSVFER